MDKPRFRTHEEMREVYDELELLPGRGHPYCITLHESARYFGFIGTSHTNDPSHPQWKIYFDEWDIFIASKNQNKIVYYEGRSNEAVGDNRTEAIKTGSDAGLTLWLAKRAGIKHLSPEPDRKEEVRILIEDYRFQNKDLIAYYVGRQIGQWVRHDRINYPNLNEYIKNTLEYMKRTWTHGFNEKTARKLIEDTVGTKDLENAEPSVFNILADPSLNPVSAASSKVRDNFLYSVLEESWRDGKDIFCVYGSGHAIVLEPALHELIGRTS